MTHILLISDTERVKRVFKSLEKQGFLQLRAAATLSQGELEISASPPAYTFAQSRISGFSGEIILRHLKKILPVGAKIILMVGDPDEMAQARWNAEPVLDLSLDDEALAGAVQAALDGMHRPGPEEAAADYVFPALKSYQQNEEEPAGAPGTEGAATEQATPPDHAAPENSLRQQDHDKASAESFAEIMRRASIKGVSSDGGGTGADQPVELGRSASESAEKSGARHRPGPEESAGPVSVREFTRGEPLADAMRRAQQKKRPKWILPLAVVLLAVAIFSYTAARKGAPPKSLSAPRAGSRPVQHPSLLPVPAPAMAPLTPPAPAPGVKPVARPSAKSAPEPAAPQVPTPMVKPAVKPILKSGLRQLPPLLTGIKLDAAYAKGHPGWQRYLGVSFEYKLFREAELYKALQVIGQQGEIIPDQLFKRALLEFGGVDSYRVASTGRKGNYLVEQGVTSGAVALTVYRNKDDLRMKAFVIYYR